MEQLHQFTGLNAAEVLSSREKHGANLMPTDSRWRWLELLKEVVLEPIFLILLAAASIYFFLGEYQEGIIMLIAIGLVSGISLFQERKSQNAIDALKRMSSPKAKVFREGELLTIPSEQLVVNDLMMVEDGDLIPADAEVIESHDFTVNESALTGESFPVTKTGNGKKESLYQGTLVLGGNCVGRVTAVGKDTTLNKLGISLHGIETSKTPLQLQISRFVTGMAAIGAVAFFIVWGLNYYLSENIWDSLLQGLTLAMSVLPEEIPVAFSTFMALGAFHLYKKQIITRSPYTVETLGAATVICVDKTGTLTENKMELAAIYEHASGRHFRYNDGQAELNEVLEYSLWASEILPFDSMEKAIHKTYQLAAKVDMRGAYNMVHEYPLGGTPPIMTHIFQNGSQDRKIAVKGSVEGVVKQCDLTLSEKEGIMKVVDDYTHRGYRVLAVGKVAHWVGAFPETQFDFQFEFLGLVCFYDPPKSNIPEIISKFYKAGIEVKMITGDYAKTAQAISELIGMKNHSSALTGTEVLSMDANELREKVKNTKLFSRMFPQAKMKVVEALKENGEIVAMTGDGVNDGPALKAAHIGVAMGLRGTEIAKKAAALVLMDDDLAHMVDAVALGRRIYENLKKAIQYIISIHIPIILIVTLPLVFFWEFTAIFSPIHVIFLELVMGPTCSIVFENEPIEPGSMNRPPRKMTSTFFSLRELAISIVQGLVITAGCLGIGYYYIEAGASEHLVRTVIFSTLIFSNVFLTLVNRSFYYSIVKTLSYSNRLMPLILLASLGVLGLALYFEPLRNVFDFAPLNAAILLQTLAVGFASVIWVEGFKLWRRVYKIT
ncbi:cation-translocating P-type ATPase [Litoribacter ruber]|uniref:Cation-translocating P-type ATPase n=1 Tax=Litoribacter ruber TaxID=702568 RepID=A0AAP2CLQ3_9BACT|nr:MULTISPECIES: cation-translocating P-type ATPase [Litoribacter]MBS9524157.1 cation-translocating P-type ATPase [Litoribacter alkaliphilus]MBT0810044.1 cation-translocating P-type ATPase [Litoribacter ruber]